MPSHPVDAAYTLGMRAWVWYVAAAFVGLVVLFGCLAAVAFRLRETMTVPLANGVELSHMEGTDFIAKDGGVLLPRYSTMMDGSRRSVRISVVAIRPDVFAAKLDGNGRYPYGLVDTRYLKNSYSAPEFQSLEELNRFIAATYPDAKPVRDSDFRGRISKAYE
ncbi:MAG TPA: hypothetical protein VD971_04785 [Phycisphaerales bacterium]|nr:hypothetical protein [Phycisphaerales bacterium]